MVLEALVVGVIATAVGFGAGIGLAAALEALLASADTGLPSASLVIGTGSVLGPVLVGLGVTLVAAVGPALHSARVSPARRAALVGRRGVPHRTGRIVAGVAAGIAGVGLIISGTTGFGHLGRVGTRCPGDRGGLRAARPGHRPSRRRGCSGAPARLLKGVTGQLAQQNAVRNPRRTAGTATALVIGIGVVAVFTVFGTSLRSSIDQEVTDSFGTTDLVVRSAAFAGSGMPADFVDEIGTLDGVRTVSAMSFGDVVLDGGTETATITDPVALDAVSDLRVVSGSLSDLAGSEVAVSKASARTHGWTTGSAVAVEFADGATVQVPGGRDLRRQGRAGRPDPPERHVERALRPGPSAPRWCWSA